MRSRLLTVLGLCLSLSGIPLPAQEPSLSAFQTRPPDSAAPTFNAVPCADHADCTAALQKAVDDLQRTRHQGVLWIPEGHYRLTGTVTVWTGIRLIGFGRHRPVFDLPDHTPGFSGDQPQPLFHFAHEYPKPGQPVQDGTSDTFYSAFENLDIDVAEGNPAAVGIRFHVAQHGILAHLLIHMHSGHAALQDVGNLAFDVHLTGGDFGIDTVRTAPGWPFMLMDSLLDGQRIAGIRTQDAGMTLERVTIAHTPVAVAIPPHQVDQLYIADSLFQSISDIAIQPGDSTNARSQVSAENLGCIGVRQLLPASPGTVPATGNFIVDRLRLGVVLGPDGGNTGIHLALQTHPGSFAEQPADAAPLPPVSAWLSVRSLGVLGDGAQDDTAALQAAIDTHPVLYLPAGRYRLTGTLHLRPDTVLIGSHPFTTQIVLADHTPAFAGAGPMMPMLETPSGGTNTLSGIGLSAGAFNPRASGVLWRAGAISLLEDVKFFGGRGTLTEDGKPLQVYPANGAISTNLSPGWSTQYPSLDVRGGGGVFRAIWSASAFARAGLLVEDTAIRGRVYGFSCEHHLYNEVQLHGVRNWRFEALQTEEEAREGRDAVSLELRDAKDLAFANLFQYRVSRSVLPADHATEVGPNAEVDFANVHIFAGGRYAYDNSLLDLRSGLRSRVRDFASFDTVKPLGKPPKTATRNTALRVLASGFTDITGLIAEQDGNVLFTDAATHKLLRWDEESHAVRQLVVPDGFLPVVALTAGPARVTVLGADGRVLELAPDGTAQELSAAALPADVSLRLPAGGHSTLSALTPALHASRGIHLGDGKAWLPTPKDMRPLLYTSQFGTITQGQSQMLASEDEARVLRFSLDGVRSPFASVGGTAIVVDSDETAYLAGEQVTILDRDGRVVGKISIPERPTALAMIPDHTLFIGARSTLYSVSLNVR